MKIQDDFPLTSEPLENAFRNLEIILAKNNIPVPDTIHELESIRTQIEGQLPSEEFINMWASMAHRPGSSRADKENFVKVSDEKRRLLGINNWIVTVHHHFADLCREVFIIDEGEKWVGESGILRRRESTLNDKWKEENYLRSHKHLTLSQYEKAVSMCVFNRFHARYKALGGGADKVLVFA